MDDVEFQRLLDATVPVILLSETRKSHFLRSIVVFIWTAALLIYALTDGLPMLLWPVLGIGLYFSLLSVWLICFPKCSSLTLSDDNFTVRDFKIKHIYYWRKHPYVWKDNSLFAVKTIAIKSSVIHKKSKVVCSNNVTLLSNYGLSDEQLVRLMNHWRKKALRQKGEGSRAKSIKQRVAAKFS